MQTPLDSDTPLPTQKWCCHQFLYKFHGFWFTQTYLQTTQNVLQSFKPLSTDIILASYPKTGTTWLKALLHSIIHRSSHEHHNSLLFNHPQELIPSLETHLYVPGKTGDASKIPQFLDAKKGRILATHLPYQIFKDVLSCCECKIVYVTRNPKDTLVSLWNFLQKSKSVEDDPWELSAAVDQFCEGIVPFGPYYDHVLAYREESLKRPENVMFVTYEELKEDGIKHVGKLAEFLGCPFEGEDGVKEVEKIVRNCSFDVLSNLEVNKSSELPSGFPLPYNSFFRKGEVGDHKNYLDDVMIKKIDDITRKMFHSRGFDYGI